MLAIESHDDVTRVVMSTRLSRSLGFDVSAYLVRGVLIDSGFPAVRQEFGAYLARVRPEGVVLTHYHEDHAGNVNLVAARGLPIALSPATHETLLAGRRIGLYRQAVWGGLEPLTTAFERYAHDALEMIPAPGHSADHHVVWDAERETLFAGDLFLGVKVRAVHGGENPRTLARSVRAAAALGPRRVFDAHRGLVRDPVGSLNAKADWLDETIAAIERGIDAGRSDRAITRAVLGREASAHYVSNGGLSRINFVRAVRATR